MHNLGGTNTWNEHPKNSNMIHPIKPTGPVVLNGKYDESLMLKAATNETPYYPTPVGQYFEYIKFAPNGLIAWSEIGSDYNISHLYTNVYDSLNPDSDKVRAAVSINGQGKGGYKDWDNYTFMEGIHIHGIITDGTDRNGSNKFNILSGGTFSIPNTGNEDILPGDYVFAYAPSKEEVMNQEGGRKTDAERNGYITLWTKPYRTSSHKITTTNVSRCLLKEQNAYDQHFSPDFQKTSNALLESQIDSMVIMSAISTSQGRKDFNQLVNAFTDEYDASAYNEEREKFINKYRKFLVEALFRHNDNPDARISNPMEKSLACQSILLRNLTRLVFGKAQTGAKPGDDFIITLCKYAK